MPNKQIKLDRADELIKEWNHILNNPGTIPENIQKIIWKISAHVSVLSSITHSSSGFEHYGISAKMLHLDGLATKLKQLISEE